MAKGNEYQLAIRIAGRVDSSFTAAVATASSGLSKLGAAGKAVGTSLKIAAKTLTAASAAAAGVGLAAVKAGTEFDSAMSQVAATMGTTMQEMQDEIGTVDLAWGTFTGNLREYAQEMGAHTAFSATQCAEALNYMALAGYDTETSMKMLPNVLNLAAAGSMELAEASDMITDTQTAFGISIDRTTQLVDEMAKAASTGNTSVQQLGEAFLTVGGLAQELNGGVVTLADGTEATVDGVQELEIALTAMANAGIKGSEAGTHMRNMLLKLSSPTADGAEQLKQLGVAVYDGEGAMRSLSDIFGDLSGALDGLTQEKKISAISALFNTRDIASAEALLNAIGQDWDGIGESILDAEGAAQQMADVQLDNLSGDITLFKSALEGTEIALSDKLTPALRDFVSFGTGELEKLTSALRDGDTDGAAEELGTVLSDMLGKIVSSAPEFMSGVQKIVGGLMQGLRDHAPELGQTAAELIGQLLTGFFDFFESFWLTGATLFEELLKGLEDKAPEIVSSAAGMIRRLVSGLLERLPEIAKSAATIISELAGSLAEELPTLIPMAVEILTTIIKAIADNLGTIVKAGIDLLLGLAEGIFEALPQLIEAIPDIIDELLTAVLDAIPQIIDGLIRLMKMLVENLPVIIQKVVEALPRIIRIVIEGVLGALPQIIDGLIQLVMMIVGNLPTIMNSLIGAMPMIISSVVTAVIDCLPDLIQGCIDLVTQLVTHLPEIIGGLIEAIPDIIGSILDAFMGENGIVAGLGGIFQQAWDAICEIFKDPGAFFAKVWEGIKSCFSYVGKFFGEVFSNAWEGIKKIFAPVGQAFAAIGKSIVNALSSVINGIIWGLNQVIRVPIDALNGILGGIKSVEIFGWKPFDWIGLIPVPEIPQIPMLAKGGVVNSATILEAGEAGSEAIIPLGQLWTQMREMMSDTLDDKTGSGGSVVVMLLQGIEALMRGRRTGSVGELADSLSGDAAESTAAETPRIVYSPTYQFYGEAPGRDDLVAASRISQDEFDEMMNNWLRSSARLSFA